MIAACLQTCVDLCDEAGNSRRALETARAAIDSGADLLVFPELFLTGFCYDRPASGPGEVTDPGSPGLEPFVSIAHDGGCLIMGSVISERLNLGFCIGPGGIQYRPKLHPFGTEKPHFDGAGPVSPIETHLGRIGLQICYDLRFPEVARSLALKGADVLVTVGEFPAARLDHWQVLCRARAIENQIPHIACNWADAGGSMIIDARGRAVAEAGAGERVITWEVDLEDRDRFREEIPCFGDRRPDLY